MRMPLIGEYGLTSLADLESAWNPVRTFIDGILGGVAGRPCAEEWAYAMQFNQFPLARRIAQQMEAYSLLGMLRDQPTTASWDLGLVYYRLVELCQHAATPMRSQMMTLHALIRRSGIYPDNFGDNPFRRPEGMPVDPCPQLPPEEEPEEVYRRIRRD